MFASKNYQSLTSRCYLPLLLVAAVSATTSAQEVRFRTNVGNFLVTLNPTANDGLQPLVNNFLAYVESGRYDGTWINRSPEDFVVQMGSFLDPGVPSTDFDFATDLTSIDRFDPVIVDADNDGVIDFDTTGLSNTRGTVALALSGNNANTGTSSFFVNIGDNSFLDSQGFIPFATIDDMTVIDAINNLPQVSLDTSLTFVDVPVLEDDRFVVIEKTRVFIPEPASAAMLLAGVLAPFGLSRRVV